MTFTGSLSMDVKDVKSFSKHPGTILFSIAFLHMVMPLWAYFLSKGKIQVTLGKKLAPFSKLCLFGVVMINSSAIAPYLEDITWELVSVILLVFFIATSGYVIALIIGRLLWKDTRIVTTFVFIGGMRNIAMGVIVATTYFPAKVAMPVVFGMLFQQILASLVSKVIERDKPTYEVTSV